MTVNEESGFKHNIWLLTELCYQVNYKHQENTQITKKVLFEILMDLDFTDFESISN